MFHSFTPYIIRHEFSLLLEYCYCKVRIHILSGPHSWHTVGNYQNFFTFFPYKKEWDKNKGENTTRSSKMSGKILEILDRLAARAQTYHRRKLRENASFRNPAVSNISRGSVSHYGYPSHYHTESHHDQKQDDPYMSMNNMHFKFFKKSLIYKF